jgi:hypothetical protein
VRIASSISELDERGQIKWGIAIVVKLSLKII